MDATGSYTLALKDGAIELNEEDLLPETTQKEGFFTVKEGNITVALDTTLTPELIEEGFVREIISKLQTMRKEANFNVTDHIIVSVQGNDKIDTIMKNNLASIQNDVLQIKSFLTNWKDIIKSGISMGKNQPSE